MWELWYTDGSVYTDKEGDFVNAPQSGIQALVRYRKREKGGIGAEICTGQDFYTVTRKAALEIKVPKSVKIGEEIDREKYDKIMDKIRAHIYSKINSE